MNLYVGVYVLSKEGSEWKSRAVAEMCSIRFTLTLQTCGNFFPLSLDIPLNMSAVHRIIFEHILHEVASHEFIIYSLTSYTDANYIRFIDHHRYCTVCYFFFARLSPGTPSEGLFRY